MNKQDSKKDNINSKELNAFYSIPNLLYFVFNNIKIKKLLLSNSDNNLFNTILKVIEIENYLEKKYKNNKNFSLKFAKILANFTQKKITFTKFKDVNWRTILLNIKYLKNYLLNQLDIKYDENNIFDTSKIENLILQSESEYKNYKKSLIENETLDGSEKKDAYNAEAFTKNIFNKANNNNLIGEMKKITKDFYPFDSKPKIVVKLKIILLPCFGIISLILLFFGICALIPHGNNNQVDIWTFFLAILSETSLWFFGSFIWKSFQKPISKMLYYYLPGIYVIFSILFLIVIFVIGWQTFNFNFNNFFSTNSNSLISDVYYSLGFGLGIASLIATIIIIFIYIFNPKLQKDKVNELNKKLFGNFNSHFNNMSNNSKNRENSQDDDADNEL